MYVGCMTGTGTPLWLPSGGLGRSRERRGAWVPVLVSCGLCNMATNSLVSDNRSFLSHDPRGQTCHLSLSGWDQVVCRAMLPLEGLGENPFLVSSSFWWPPTFLCLKGASRLCLYPSKLCLSSRCLSSPCPVSLCSPFRRTLVAASRAQLDNLSMSKPSV